MLWRYADVATNCNCLQLKTGYMFDLQNGLLTQKSHTPVMSSANPNLPPCWDPVCLLAVKLTFQHNISPPFHTHCRPGSDSRGSKKKKTFITANRLYVYGLNLHWLVLGLEMKSRSLKCHKEESGSRSSVIHAKQLDSTKGI